MPAKSSSRSVSEHDLPDEEEVAEALAEELGKLRVENILVGALIQVSSVGYRKLGLTEETKSERDLEQTRIAIETMMALVPVLQQVIPEDLLREFEQSVAGLQLAYAKARSEEAGGEG
jgi:hypothetical protein